MTKYVALLRGINVGGNQLIKMAELKTALQAAGLQEVQTYIQSGNVIFNSKIQNKDTLARTLAATIQKKFKHQVDVALFTAEEWHDIIKAAPKWWGKDKTWKHNLLIMIKPFDMTDTVQAIGKLKPDIEKILPGAGVLYQSISFTMFGRATSGKLAANPVYKKMTIRNFNTATKLAMLINLPK